MLVQENRNVHCDNTTCFIALTDQLQNLIMWGLTLPMQTAWSMPRCDKVVSAPMGDTFRRINLQSLYMPFSDDAQPCILTSSIRIQW